jgi:exodeoxyribonuclease V alpha subunit
LTFAPEQIADIEVVLMNKVSVLTNGPGSGKKIILSSLITILIVKKVNIVLCAPTGRAAQKISETTGKSSQTIHRLLQYKPGEHTFFHDESIPLKLDFIVIDEASMVDIFLAAAVFKALPTTAHVLLVGDVNQLPSIRQGNMLGDVIKSEKFRVTRLKRIFRQEACSEIVSVAHNIIDAVEDYPEVAHSFENIDPSRDFHFIKAETSEICLEKIILLCQKYLPLWYNVDPINDVQILVPVHQGIIGTENLNTTFQNIFIPKEYGGPWTQFRIKDKIIQIRNNYEKKYF